MAKAMIVYVGYFSIICLLMLSLPTLSLSDKTFHDSLDNNGEEPSDDVPSKWKEFWVIGSTPRDSWRSFVSVYLLEQLGENDIDLIELSH